MDPIPSNRSPQQAPEPFGAYTDAYGVTVRGLGVRFGRVTVRVDRNESGAPVPPHDVQFPGMAIASTRTIPGVTLYLTPSWKIVLYNHMLPGEDGSGVGALRVFDTLDEVRTARTATDEPLCPATVFEEAQQRVATLYGNSIPNDFERVSSGSPAESPPQWLDV
jgi:hypothetical protein